MSGAGESGLPALGEAAQALSSDSDAAPSHAIESLCMRCGENGTTRILLTKIPHFREVVLMAFECTHCNERNNEIQFAGQFESHGCTYSLTVPAGDLKVLNRQVVKSDSGSIKIPELDFEVPPQAQRGVLSTVEGVLLRAAEELEALQPERRKVDPKTAEALGFFLLKLKACASGEQAFTFIIDDPSGNSFIENPNAPATDPMLNVHFYTRTADQHAALGLVAETREDLPSVDRTAIDSSLENSATVETEATSANLPPHGSVGAAAAHRAIMQGSSEKVAAALFKYSAPEEVMSFPSTCWSCSSPCETRMFVTNIPYFKEVIVMASTCDHCGYRNSEVKAGGSMSEKGRKLSLHVVNREDLNRDIIKSDTAAVEIPEVELELAAGTLGGIVTTVEGLVSLIADNLRRMHGFSIGDSADVSQKSRWEEFHCKLQQLLNLEKEWTLILDDSLSNSFIAPATDSYDKDSQLSCEDYERSWEQDEELGLHDMDTSSADVAYETTKANA